MTPWAMQVVSKLKENQSSGGPPPQVSVDAWAMQVVFKLPEKHLVGRPTSAGQH